MKTFPGWRAVGRAMMWARRQDGVEHVVRKTSYCGEDVAVDFIWRGPNRAHVTAQRLVGPTGLGEVDVSAEGEHTSAEIGDEASVEQLLRVLAALDLIPAEYAEARDERYARCCVCGLVVTWAPGNGVWRDRWVHLNQRAWLAGTPHVAEVAAEAASLCRCAWLGVGTPEHERGAFCRPAGDIPTDLAEAGPAAADTTQEHHP